MGGLILPNPPILLYHNIGNDGKPLSLAVAEFAAQMDYLKRIGYVALPLEAAFGEAPGMRIRGKPIALTFDDGFKGIFDNALPILDKHGFAATVFIVTNYMETGRLLEGYETLTGSHLATLVERGWYIGAHTCSHAVLTDLSAGEAIKEIAESKQCIENRIDRPVISFAYPKGLLDEATRELVRCAGFLLACSIWLPKDMEEDRLSLQRIAINKYNPFAHFALKISSVYRWMLKRRYTRFFSRRRIK